MEEYCMYPQGVCRIRKPAYAGNGCAIFPVFDTEEWAEKIRSQPQTIYSEVPKIIISQRIEDDKEPLSEFVPKSPLSCYGA